MKKLIASVLCLALLATILAGCGSSNTGANANAGTGSTSSVSGSIAMDGSSALLPLAQTAATQFQAKNPDCAITANGGGSGTGLNDVLAGTVDIGNSDVYAAEKLTAADAAKLVDHKVALIGVATIVNADVAAAVKSLSSDQLKSIFSGQTKNWSVVGGPNEAITIINRPTSSGTRSLFQKWALGGQKSVEGATSLQTDDSKALLTTVGATKGAIGYVALSYLVQPSAQIGTVGIDGVDATYANIYNNTYQVWGYEHMYTKGQPKANVQAFLDYMSSADMASTIESSGYGVIASLNAAAAASR
ncbi:MAG: phosphate ABC transporter substrate-binding protein [Coriobacteriia bacterium]|nr:phosphate ABC transporter substrate-binding protein [Coriobacteriia bacterium]